MTYPPDKAQAVTRFADHTSLAAVPRASLRGRPIHTYSIVARDPVTGQMGVAVQSHWYSVGSIVSWAEAGVGAVATQSFVDPSYGALGLDLMRGGKSAPDALRSLLAVDPQPAVRQVAMVDAQGRVGAHTGEHCVAFAGNHIGAQYSTQANMMLKSTVWDAMAGAYDSATGDLAARLLAALAAAEGEGGDIRGRQSAAIVVVSGVNTGRPWTDRIVDLRVEDHPDPVGEIKRLVALKRAYDRMNRGDELMASNDVEAALGEYAAASQAVPDNIEMVFWHAVTLVNVGRFDESVPLFRRVFAHDMNWAEMLKRLPKAGLFANQDGLIDRIIFEVRAQ
jgi:uncharacterized Ntn-hydrolase superfamily protein